VSAASAAAAPVLLIGAGRMGSALLSGWAATGTISRDRMLIRTPHPNETCVAWSEAGAMLNPPDDALAAVRTVVLAVKPQKWREVAAAYAPLLAEDAVILSVVVGVRAETVSAAFQGRPVVRVLPTTAVEHARGVASVFAADPEARARAHGLFDPVAIAVDIEDEDHMDAASAVSASGAAYVYAFVDALQQAGEAAGLAPETASLLARATAASASEFMLASGEPAATLIGQVASPGGTTRAALAVLDAEPGLKGLMRDAVAAAVKRAEELAG
jgi:pyrroline-5-carboxylate reductase